jgi:chorismate--pyruvate lyase
VNRWLSHLAAVHAAPALRDWLRAPGSLTGRLREHCLGFNVRLLRQGAAVCLADQAAALQLARPTRVIEREVLLVCDGLPVVYAQTVLPAGRSRADWPFFKALGSRSLGSALFGDPAIARGALQHARLSARHPLAQRALAALPAGERAAMLHARRCLYRRRRGLLLVTELFLPAIAQLMPRRLISTEPDRQ